MQTRYATEQEYRKDLAAETGAGDAAPPAADSFSALLTSAEDRRAPVPMEFLAEIWDALGEVLDSYKAGITALQTQVAALKAAGPSMSYEGTWVDSRSYERGHVVTLGGGMWFCHRTTRHRPGESGDWQLCVKAGRDASR